MLHSFDYDVITGKHDDIFNTEGYPFFKKNSLTSWSPSSWKDFPIEQNPEYPDQCALQYYQTRLKSYPPLVLASEIRHFKNVLSLATEGKAFILQGGDCAESFDSCKSTVIKDLIYTFGQMSGLIHQSIKLPIINIGRIAGQYAKPRSNPFETQDGVDLPSYRGEIINGLDFTDASRTPDPHRMLNAYYHSSATLNLIRAVNSSDSPEYSYRCNIKIYPGSTEQSHYIHFLEELYRTSSYLSNKDNASKSMYISHEALLLPYEESMTRQDSSDQKWYNCSAHMVWVGERTRDINQAHIEYLRGIENPIGIKCGPKMSSETLIELINKLNPNNELGKIILIIRMGVNNILDSLPNLIASVKNHGAPVIWMIDPMHGNTKGTNSGYKTRHFSDMKNEVLQFISVLKNAGIHPGGLHLEMTGKDVTECTGGLQEINTNDISYKYQTLCDPRLNRMQSLELAYFLGQNW
ncbi:3-deoxy-7-phosphoheptulonate synthase class II [Providencia alcalifaciens]|uniref:3-deoxy-7-phosphoheptulonate synthase class II n=1 Tax=Providencia alcalifaciens TaxID=126385 RepID=UPI001CC4BC2E|nr:3-deoxy-7-phosphoheptulonate synthase class II [Providencia alcalifaciens]CAG9406353.1 Phospho-2-dehydro-3-deoxyheptonate aldolase [Providencia alcalifaciens]